MPIDTQTRNAAELRVEVERSQRAYDQKRGMLLTLLKSTKAEDGTRQIMPHQAEQIRQLETECRKLDGEVKGLIIDHMQAEAEEGLNTSKNSPYYGIPIHPGAGGQDPDGWPKGAPASKAIQHLPDTLGDAFVDSASYKAWNRGASNQNCGVDIPLRSGVAAFALKTTLSVSAQSLTGYERPPGVVMLGQQQLTVADLCAQGTTTQPTVRVLCETSFTNGATTVSEGSGKPEQSWLLDERDFPVRKIAVWTKVTDEMFADFPAVRSYVNERMPFAVRQHEELQILNGAAATAPQLVGILNTTGVQTQARGTDTNVDAIYKGITKVRFTGFYEPDSIVIDPTNWTPIRLLKTTTGEYVWGAPSVVGPETLFGKTVVVTANMIDNSALVGAFRQGAMIFYREGMRIEATNSSDDDFKNNLICIRAEQREALVVWRPPAFCKVTGLST